MIQHTLHEAADSLTSLSALATYVLVTVSAITLNQWLQIATLVWICLQIVLAIYNNFFKKEPKK